MGPNELTSMERRILDLFLNAPGRCVGRNELILEIWGETHVHPKTIDVHLYNLRKKLQLQNMTIKAEVGAGRWVLTSYIKSREPLF